MDNTNSTAIAAMIILFGLFLLFLIVLLYVVPMIITTWILYRKAGQRGWAAIIPIYSQIVEARIGKVPLWIALFVGIDILVGNLVPRIIQSALINSQQLSSSNISLLALDVVSLILSLVAFGLSIFMLVRWAKSYDRPVSFWLYYAFLPIVAVFLVKDATYIGTPGPQDAVTAPMEAQITS